MSPAIGSVDIQFHNARDIEYDIYDLSHLIDIPSIAIANCDIEFKNV
jgi:hypothetical protein